MSKSVDFYLGGEKLYYRKKITHFLLEEILWRAESEDKMAVCIYFKFDAGFSSPVELDYVEVESESQFSSLQEILIKDDLDNKDICKLIQLFHKNLSEQVVLFIVQNGPYKYYNFNDIYFTIYE